MQLRSDHAAGRVASHRQVSDLRRRTGRNRDHPKGLNFSERYKILENTTTDLVAAISITKFSDHPPPGIGAVVIIIAKQNGLFQQSGAILGLRTGDPTLGHCERQ
jgi:hypothetical protein